MSNLSTLHRIKRKLEKEEAFDPDATQDERDIAAISARVLGQVMRGKDVDAVLETELRQVSDPTVVSCVTDMVKDLLDDYPL